MPLLDSLLAVFRKKPSPTETYGTGGTAVYGGYIDEGEKNAKLAGQEKYRTYTNLLANTSIVAASVRYCLTLIAKADWKAEPADDSEEAQRISDWFSDQIHNMTTPWHRVVRRAGLYRYYGFSIQEWTAKRNEDGSIGILDVESRPQHTIEQWALDEGGTVIGVVQRSPQSQETIPLPRGKLVYVVDDSLADSPEGLGLFRHVVEAIDRLREYERLECIGFETDLRGIPVGRAPITTLQSMVKNGLLSQQQYEAQLNQLRDFLQKHKKTANLSLMLDSRVYESTGDNRTPSSQPQWGVDVIKAGQTSAPEVAAAIMRINREVARVLGTENILLGESGAGSLAMAQDKSDQFAMMVDSTLKELAQVFQSDLVKPFMKLNGWDEKLAPKLTPNKIQYRSVEEITAALRDMATAGAVLAPDDPAINDLRTMLGLTKVDLEQMAMDAAMQREAELAVLQAKATQPPIGPGGKPGAKPGEKPGEGTPTKEPQPTQKLNPNHDDQGRFARGTGAGGPSTAGSYSEIESKHKKLGDTWEKNFQAIPDMKDALEVIQKEDPKTANHVKRLNEARSRLNRSIVAFNALNTSLRDFQSRNKAVIPDGKTYTTYDRALTLEDFQ
jgi:hypothetical protein